MIYIIDTYAWIEYFRGSKLGKKVKKILEKKKCATLESTLAEIITHALRENEPHDLMIREIKSLSIILPVMIGLWFLAAKTRHEMRKKKANFGLMDAIMLAKARELKAKVVTGDSHFKNLKEAVYLE